MSEKESKYFGKIRIHGNHISIPMFYRKTDVGYELEFIKERKNNKFELIEFNNETVSIELENKAKRYVFNRNNGLLEEIVPGKKLSILFSWRQLKPKDGYSVDKLLEISINSPENILVEYERIPTKRERYMNKNNCFESNSNCENCEDFREGPTEYKAY